MIIIALRTLFVYIFLTFFMRITGKRQVGQLQIGELVTALLLSEIAAFPIADPNVPLLFAIVPVTLIVSLEILFAALCALFPKAKKFIEGTPALLIVKGRLDQKELRKNRIAPDELLAQLRLKGISDVAQVDYAILEQNGQLSVIPKAEKQAATPEDLGLRTKGDGLARPLIVGGVWDKSNLRCLNLTKEAVAKRLGQTKVRDVLLYTVNDSGKTFLIRSEPDGRRGKEKK